MKIPILPYHVVSAKEMEKLEDRKRVADIQVAKLLGDNFQLMELYQQEKGSKKKG
jgi:hypothetical protein